MSWILGYIGPGKVNISLRKYHHTPLYKIDVNHTHIITGGNSKTCFHIKTDKESGWIVSGVGLKLGMTSVKLFSYDDWVDFLFDQNPDFNKIDGHFIALKYQNGLIKCYNDQLGLRTIFITKIKNGILFSTRLDWAAQLSKISEIDFKEFSSIWLSSSQISHKNLIKGIHRLSPGGKAVITKDSLNLEKKPWYPDKNPLSSLNCQQVLKSFLKLDSKSNEPLSLGLSGGLDSRVLLSLFLNNNDKNHFVHTFGQPDEPDIIVASRIAANESLQLSYYNDPLPDLEKMINLMSDYASRTFVIEPVSSIFKLKYYYYLEEQNKIAIDGAFGEMARRQYSIKLLFFGKKDLIEGNIKKIAKHFIVNRPTIFTQDVYNIMKNGLIDTISSEWQSMPDIKTYGIENFIDLLNIRNRLPFYQGTEQARLDEEIISYMPFAQPTFLNNILIMSPEQKRDGKWFRSLINENRPSLKKYPLVKNNIYYPYQLNTISAAIWKRAKVKLGLNYTDDLSHLILQPMKEFIFDIVNSSEVVTYPAYNHVYIKHIITNYYNGNKEQADSIIWWLTFELWRKSLTNK